jgi:preprotein translocase subunit SecG
MTIYGRKIVAQSRKTLVDSQSREGIMSRTVLWLVVILPGLAGIVVFGIFALIDWAALQAAYAHFERVASGHPAVAPLLAAEAKQDIHRLNLFAEGVWTLLSAIYMAVGIHGLVLLKRP